MTHNPGPLHAMYWTARKWFAFLAALLLLWVSAYIVLHANDKLASYEYIQLNNTQLQQINGMLYADRLPQPAPLPALFQQITVNELGDTLSVTSPTAAPAPVQAAEGISEAQIDKVLFYIKTEFENRLRADQLQTIKDYIKTFGPGDVGVYLSGIKLRARSYFWLSGPMVYAEMIFWVIGGVICSVLFSIASVSRRVPIPGVGNTTFNSKEISYQVAKLFYAPFCAVVLVLAYNFFRHDTTLNIAANEGIIVFSFIAGFYSGRVMSLLERLKDALLPDGNHLPQLAMAMPMPAPYAPQPVEVPRPQPVAAPYVAAPVAEPRPQPVPVPPPPAPPAPEPRQPEPAAAAKEPAPTQIPDAPRPPSTLVSEPYIPPTPKAQPAPQPAPAKEPEPKLAGPASIYVSSQTPPPAPRPAAPPPPAGPTAPTGATGPEANTPQVHEAQITLKLDTNDMPEAERTRLRALGLSNAVVTLHNVNGKEVLTATPDKHNGTATFIAQRVKPGIYIVRATLTQRLAEDMIVNLFGEKTAYITTDKPGVELYIKKYEAID